MTKKIPGAPKWLSKKPEGSKKRLITSEVSAYVKKCAEDGNKLTSSTKLIPNFIASLAEENTEFGKIKSHMQVTTFPFIDYLRLQIRFAITKYHKDKEDTKTTPKKDAKKDAASNQGSDDADKKGDDNDGD